MSALPPASEILTFLIADVRGYTSFTRTHGDEAAARFARAFAELTREGVEAHGGSVIELRGDEALAVFSSPRGALRAAVELQHVLVDEVELDPSLPLRVGIGLDTGEAVPVDGGYRGGALNLAARLCGQAGPGEVLASQGVLHLAGAVEGLELFARGDRELKGLAEPLAVHSVHLRGEESGDLARRLEAALADGRVGPRRPREVPPSLATLTPLFGRELEARALRWAWRRARHSDARALLVAGPEGIGKTRLAADLASVVADEGALVLYASCRGVTVGARAAVTDARRADAPTLLVLDDLEGVDAHELAAVAELVAERHRLLVVCAYREEQTSRGVQAALARLAGTRQEPLRLGPVDEQAVRAIAALYVDTNTVSVPQLLEESEGVPGRVHRSVSELAQQEAERRLEETAARTATRRGDLRATEAELAGRVLGLRQVQERSRLYGKREAGEDAEACPFKGLATFEAADAPLFFGRERLVAELVSKLVGARMLCVVGPSGSGKSSLVRAGLLPALASGALPGSGDWLRALLRPGRKPLRELDRALFAAFPDQLREALEPTDDPLAGALTALPPGEQVVLLIDQFEEVFSFALEPERAAFIDSLVAAACDPDGRALVVLALRADFYGRCAQYPAFAELIGANSVLVSTMTPDEYARAIERPATRAGLRVDPELVEALVADVADEPGGLPLLSTALVELWQRREGRALRLRTYEESGGVRGAVARLAEEAFAALTPAQQRLARGVMLRLAAGEGEGVVRRRVPLAEFDASRNEDVGSVLERFTHDRLVTVSDGSVEVSHEALLREWPRLRDWLEEDREGRRLREHLTEQAREWSARGRDPGDLYRGARLAAALEWTSEHTLELNELEREFLEESRAAAEREAERQQRANRRLRGLLVAAGVLLALALVAGAFALISRAHAKDEATAAVAERLGAQALLVQTPDLSLLLARQAVALSDSPATEGNLQIALLRAPTMLRIARPLPGSVLGWIDASPAGRYVLVGAQDINKVALLDPALRKERVLENVSGFFDDGRLVVPPQGCDGTKASVGGTGALDLKTGRLQTLCLPLAVPLRRRYLRDLQLVFSSDLGTAVEVGSILQNNTAQLAVLSVRSKRILHRLVVPAGTESDLRSGKLVLVRVGPLNTGPTGVEVWSLQPWRRISVLRLRSWAYALDASGRRMAVPGLDGTIRIYDLGTRHSIDLRGPRGASITDLRFSPDGRWIASVDSDSRVFVWNAATGDRVDVLSGRFAVFSGDSQTLYTASADGTVIAWDIGGSRRLGRPFRAGSGNVTSDPNQLPLGAAVSPDGRLLATTEDNGRTSLVDLASGRRLAQTPAVPGGRVAGVAWAPDGKSFATADGRGRVETWRRSGSLRRSYSPSVQEAPVGAAVVFSPDGKFLAASDSASQVHLWDVLSGRDIADFDTEGPALGLAFSHDGRILVAASGIDAGGGRGLEDFVNAWHLPDGRLIYAQKVNDLGQAGQFVAFTADDKVLATAGSSGVVKFLDAHTGKPVGDQVQTGPVDSIAFDRSGKLMVTGGADGSARLFDVKSRSQYGGPFPAEANRPAVAAFTTGGTNIVVVNDQGRATLWNIRPTSWAQRACAIAGRRLTRAEWAQYLPGRSYHPACN